jgi:hypothetical protein
MEFRASSILRLAGIASAQVSFPPAGNALATLAHQPETRVTWSKEVGRLESGESHAIFTVVRLENSNPAGAGGSHRIVVDKWSDHYVSGRDQDSARKEDLRSACRRRRANPRRPPRVL